MQVVVVRSGLLVSPYHDGPVATNSVPFDLVPGDNDDDERRLCLAETSTATRPGGLPDRQAGGLQIQGTLTCLPAYLFNIALCHLFDLFYHTRVKLRIFLLH